jgi:sialic acid synthase SpsE
VLADADIAFRRPGTGMPPADAHRLTGRALARGLAAGAPITPGDLQ